MSDDHPPSQATITRLRSRVAWAESKLKTSFDLALEHLPSDDADGVQVSPSHSLDTTYDEIHRRASQTGKERLASDASVQSVWSEDGDRQVSGLERPAPEDLVNISFTEKQPPPKSAFDPFYIINVLVKFEKDYLYYDKMAEELNMNLDPESLLAEKLFKKMEHFDKNFESTKFALEKRI